MPIVDIALPIKGRNEGMPIGSNDMATTGYINNCRPRDVLENKFRIGQRPGLKKAYSQQIGGAAYPVIELLSITTVS